MQNLKVALVQADLAWENPIENINQFNIWLDKIEGADLIVLPEMFATGFSMQPTYFASTNGMEVTWMKEQAAKKNALIIGSLAFWDGEDKHNRLFAVFPDGRVETYDKRHLFTLAGEQNHYSPGNKQLLITHKNWKIRPMICYDLRFPVWARNHDGYDVLLYVANWPGIRSYAWNHLLIARSIENQCYTIGVNRVGKDGKDIVYQGDTQVVDPMGEVKSKLTYNSGVLEFELNAEFLQQIRNKFQFLQDQDKFKFE